MGIISFFKKLMGNPSEIFHEELQAKEDLLEQSPIKSPSEKVEAMQNTMSGFQPQTIFEYDSDTKKHSRDTGPIQASAKRWITAKDLFDVDEYVVLDVETTGTRWWNDDKIVEVGVALVKGAEIVERVSSLVNPGRKIPEQATKINHISDEDVSGAPSFATISEDVLQMVKGRIVVGHNVSFDLHCISCEMPFGVESFDVEYIDTLTLCRRLYPNAPSHRLEAMIKQMGIADHQEHRANSDVEITKLLFESCRNEVKKREDEEKERKRAERKAAKVEKAARFGWSPLLDKNFVFSGEFQGNREHLESDLEQVGANLRLKVNSNTDYLVIGELKNLPQWALERKYLIAKKFYDNGGKIKIIIESEYINLIEQVKELKPNN